MEGLENISEKLNTYTYASLLKRNAGCLIGHLTPMDNYTSTDINCLTLGNLQKTKKKKLILISLAN